MTMLYIALAILITPIMILFINFMIGIKKGLETPISKPNLILPHPDIYGVQKKQRRIGRLLGTIFTLEKNGH